MLESAGWVLLAMLWVATIVTYLEVPDLIPIHYNFEGIITKYGDKITLLFFPLTATIMLIGLSLLVRNPLLFTRESGSVKQYSIRMFRWLKISLALVFSIVMVFIHVSTLDHENNLQPYIFPTVIAIVAIPVSYYIYKILASIKS